MMQWEVRFDKRSFDPIAHVGERNLHNAYDADETFTLFRADAVFTHKDKKPVVPVFAAKNKSNGEWKWWVRFRPHEAGRWTVRIQVLCWHQNRVSGDTDKDKRKWEGKEYYEHEFVSAERGFNVIDGKLPGPLETPKKDKDNPNYFYRWTNDIKGYKRRPFFILGAARPWVSEKRKTESPWSSYSYLEREKQLFEPMEKKGCNALLHWMAPWESQLVHQQPYDYWPQKNGTFKGHHLPYSVVEKSYQSKARFEGSDSELGYKRYDQGRALHTDNIFNLADKYSIMLFLVVMPHNLLRDCNHDWSGLRFGKSDEEGYRKCKQEIKNREKLKHPSQLNGFQLFKKGSRTISVEDFFSMHPCATDAWKRQLWKHYANYWRYLIGRWTAHPSLAAWIIIDEIDGIGRSSNWWWEKKNKDLTCCWHDMVVKLIRGKLKWTWAGKTLPYTGDYLHHPLTSSATDYEGTDRKERCEKLIDLRYKKQYPDPGKRRELAEKLCSNEKYQQELEKTTKTKEALDMINKFGEKEGHGNWQGKKEKIDFVSHHAYHVVPTWGEWVGPKHYKPSRKFTGWHKTNSKKGAKHIRTNRWLWDSLCMRMNKWTEANSKQDCPLFITEYGCYERDFPWFSFNQYGERYPSYAHFANWAALMLGHAGIPFKWNDGGTFGEMAGRTVQSQKPKEEQPDPWHPSVYPVDIYAEITSIANFLKEIHLYKLYPSETDARLCDLLQIVDSSGKKVKHFNAWALADLTRTTIAAWIYNRTFSAQSRYLKLKVKVSNKGENENKTYVCRWFNTWDGRFFFSCKAKSDFNEILEIRLPTLPMKTNKGVRVADGNDIAVLITDQKISKELELCPK
jgi:hypothetical protein